MDEQTYWVPVRMNRPAYSGAAGSGGGGGNASIVRFDKI